MNTWVIPCRFDPIVFDCVASIRTHHPDDRVIVVDSCSPDQSYLDDLDCDVLVGNEHYAWGAYAQAFDGQGDRWHFVHDSFVLQRRIDLTWEPLVAVRWETYRLDSIVYDDEMRGWALGVLADLGIEHPDEFPLLFGPMLLATTDAVRLLWDVGAFDIKPTNRVEANGMERVGGVICEHLGLPTNLELHPDAYTKHFRDRP